MVAKGRLATPLVAHTNELESDIHLLEQVPSQGGHKPAQLIPTRFVFASKLTRNDKLLLGFDAFVLSERLRCDVGFGKIIHGKEHTTMKVKTSLLANEVRKLIGKITELLVRNSPPDLVLNRHCAKCEFQSQCRQKAIEKDELSLLSGMTEKERRTFNNKGIFTVTQLSYTFRPRRRPRQLAGKREKYHHSLKALALRERKIHIAGAPGLKIEGTPVYLDVEALPDDDFYYLIGVRIRTAKAVVHYSLWANKPEDEKNNWFAFLEILSGLENPILVHYGSFETTFLKTMRKRYGTRSEVSDSADLANSSVNVLSVIYAHVYFPTFSNGLREIAGHLGFQWSDSTASGLQSIVWRDEWDTSGSPNTEQALITYNSDDCAALELVVNTLVKLQSARPEGDCSASDDVVHTATMRRGHPYGFKRNTFSMPELDAINKAAYWDYQRERIYVKSNTKVKRAVSHSSRAKGRRYSPNKIIECPRPVSCSKCNSTDFIGHGTASKTVLDVRFMPHGIKRWITRYNFHRYKCQRCGVTFYSEERPWTRSKYGSELVAYSLYQNIDFRLPQETVDRKSEQAIRVPSGGRKDGKNKSLQTKCSDNIRRHIQVTAYKAVRRPTYSRR